MRELLIEWRELVHLVAPLLRIATIWLLVLIALLLTRRLVGWKQRLIERMGPRRNPQRATTLANVLRHTVNIVVLGMAVLMTMGELGISITPLLTTAGIAGVAIGFGVQSLVKDFFTGIFLLVENQISEGDAIEVAGKSGVVEGMTLRHVRLRDYDGAVHFIPNSVITVLTNRSRGFAYAVVDVSVPRALPVEEVFPLMRAVDESMRKDPKLANAVLEPIDIAGVEQLSDSAVMVRTRLKAVPGRQWRVRREFLRRLQPLIDAELAARKKKAEEAAQQALQAAAKANPP